MKKIRVAILYASVGTGHKTAAKALAKWFSAVSPDVEVLCLDTLSFYSPIVRGIYTRSYLELVRKMPQLWGYFYDTMDNPSARDGVLATLAELTEKVNTMTLLNELENFAPHAVLFTHFFGSQAVLDKFQGQVPVCYVNTDFLSHVFHRNPAFYAWFAASEETLEQYLADGLESERIFLTGIPVDPIYSSPPSKEEGRSKLGIDSRANHILVMGGGIGVGPIEEVLASLYKDTDALITVICGNNEKLFQKLSNQWEDVSRVEVKGFVDNIIDYYASCDLVFMKPGGLSTSELLCMGKPIILTDPIPGQEQRNSDYLLDRQAARVLFEYRRAASKANMILSSCQEMRRLRENAKKISRPFAGRDIVLKTLEIAQKHKIKVSKSQ